MSHFRGLYHLTAQKIPLSVNAHIFALYFPSSTKINGAEK